jgi:hypothetical protein
MSEWQDIATAPRDGSYVDLWADGGRETNAYWGRPQHECGEAGGYCDCCPSYDGWVDSTFNHYLTGEDGLLCDPPTHWQPLPPAPDQHIAEREVGL